MTYLNKDYFNSIAQGVYSNTSTWSKIGFNAAITTEQDLAPWLGAGSTPALNYLFPTSELAMTIVSSSNNDTGLTGMIKTYSITAGANQGSGYSPGDIITITQPGGSDGQIKVLTIGAGGSVATSELHLAGSGYSAANNLPTTSISGVNCLVNILTTSTQSTGARTATIYWLDDEFVETATTVTMNGDTPVKINDGIYRINNARVMSVGSAAAAVGNLSIKNGANTYGYISATKTRARQLVYSVPFNKTLYVTNIAFSCAGQASTKYTRFTTRANFDDKTGSLLPRGLFLPYNEIVISNTAFERDLNPPTKLAPTVDLKVSVFADATVVVTSTLRGYMITE